MRDKTVAIIGGDRREIQVVPALLAAGWQIRSFGLPSAFLPQEVCCCESVRQAVSGVDALILPMPGVREDGTLYTSFLKTVHITAEDLAEVHSGTPLIVGVASDYLLKLAEKQGIIITEVLENDCVARQNAIPTAEGAIQLAMENTPVTIDGLKSLVIGYGRIGQALADRLRALGANTTVVNRGATRRAAAIKDGFNVQLWDNLHVALSGAEVVFNTVPAQVLDGMALKKLGRHALVIDLAGAGGGVDKKAAEELGIHYIFAPGLPGKVAPVTAGRVLAGLYPRLLNELTS